MSISVGSNPYSSAGSAAAYSAPAAAKSVTADAEQTDTPVAGGSDTVTLSDAAKAYLASLTADAKTLAADARTWLDQQYKATGLSSPMLDGEVALDMTAQSRATLSAVAANTDGLFSKDETTAAATTLQKRFDDAMTPHVVVARHSGDYASLYQAAADYLDQAGADERATPLWISTRKAVTDGLALAKATPMKAPAATDANDPVHALLARTASAAATTGATDDASVATAARARLDAQANKARDAGTQLVFDSRRANGQMVDFTGFDNQSLAVVTLNQDSQFSPDETRAAKQELDKRNRASILSLFDGSGGASDVQSQSLALLGHYNSMSAAERAATGYNADLQTRLMQNYRTASMFSGNASSSSGSTSTSAPTSLLSYI